MRGGEREKSCSSSSISFFYHERNLSQTSSFPSAFHIYINLVENLKKKKIREERQKIVPDKQFKTLSFFGNNVLLLLFADAVKMAKVQAQKADR